MLAVIDPLTGLDMLSSNSNPSVAKSADGSLSRDRIVAIARHLLETSGIESVTMRRVANELGVTAMALYRHVADKQSLLALVADAVIGEAPEPQQGPWHERLRNGLLAVHREIIRYPGLGLYNSGPNGFNPSGLRKMQRTIAMLTGAGFDDEEALSAMYLLLAYQGGYFALEQKADRGLSRVGDPQTAALPTAAGNGQIPVVSSYEAFARGLDTLVAGLRAQLAAKRPELQ